MPPPNNAAITLFAYAPDGELSLLLVRMRADGLLSSPGGGIEAGESTEMAALRESREEVGYDLPESAVCIGSFVYFDGTEIFLRLLPLGEDLATGPRPTSCTEVSEVLFYPVSKVHVPMDAAVFRECALGSIFESVCRFRAWEFKFK